MSWKSFFRILLKAALERGLITVEKVDTIVTRILTEKFRIGLFEKPYADEGAIRLQMPETIALAREVAEQAVVILDNNGVLPLKGHQRIALVGPTADDPLALLGDYSFPVHLIVKEEVEDTRNVVTPRTAFETALAPDLFAYAKGCHILEQRRFGAPVFPGDVDDSTSLDQASSLSADLSLIPQAVKAAEGADVAIVCVGDLSGIFQTGTVGEGSDVDTLVLPGVQQQLLEAVVATGTPTIVVLTSGRPYNLGGLEPRLAAQVMAFFGGQEGGTALVNVLTGATEPSGRLTISVPHSAGAAPYFYNHKFKSSGTPIARHFGSRYPFGHGMSFTEFVFEDIAVEREEIDIATGEIAVAFTIRNAGQRPGVAVPQLYIRDQITSIVRPVKELKAFERVKLESGEVRRLSFKVPTDMLSFTGPELNRIVEPGKIDLMIGASSADIRLRASVRLTGERLAISGKWRMVSTCQME